MLSTAFAAFVAAHLGWRAVFVLSAVVCGLSTIGLIFFLPSSSSVHARLYPGQKGGGGGGQARLGSSGSKSAVCRGGRRSCLSLPSSSRRKDRRGFSKVDSSSAEENFSADEDEDEENRRPYLHEEKEEDEKETSWSFHLDGESGGGRSARTREQQQGSGDGGGGPEAAAGEGRERGRGRGGEVEMKVKRKMMMHGEGDDADSSVVERHLVSQSSSSTARESTTSSVSLARRILSKNSERAVVSPCGVDGNDEEEREEGDGSHNRIRRADDGGEGEGSVSTGASLRFDMRKDSSLSDAFGEEEEEEPVSREKERVLGKAKKSRDVSSSFTPPMASLVHSSSGETHITDEGDVEEDFHRSQMSPSITTREVVHHGEDCRFLEKKEGFRLLEQNGETSPSPVCNRDSSRTPHTCVSHTAIGNTRAPVGEQKAAAGGVGGERPGGVGRGMRSFSPPFEFESLRHADEDGDIFFSDKSALSSLSPFKELQRKNTTDLPSAKDQDSPDPHTLPYGARTPRTSLSLDIFPPPSFPPDARRPPPHQYQPDTKPPYPPGSSPSTSVHLSASSSSSPVAQKRSHEVVMPLHSSSPPAFSQQKNQSNKPTPVSATIEDTYSVDKRGGGSSLQGSTSPAYSVLTQGRGFKGGGRGGGRGRLRGFAQAILLVWRLPFVLSCSFGYFLIKLIRYSLLFWLPFFLAKEAHLHASTAGYASMIFDIGGIGGAVFGGFLADRVMKGRRLTCATAMSLLTGFSLLLLAFSCQQQQTLLHRMEEDEAVGRHALQRLLETHQMAMNELQEQHRRARLQLPLRVQQYLEKEDLKKKQEEKEREEEKKRKKPEEKGNEKKAREEEENNNSKSSDADQRTSGSSEFESKNAVEERGTKEEDKEAGEKTKQEGKDSLLPSPPPVEGKKEEGESRKVETPTKPVDERNSGVPLVPSPVQSEGAEGRISVAGHKESEPGFPSSSLQQDEAGAGVVSLSPPPLAQDSSSQSLSVPSDDVADRTNPLAESMAGDRRTEGKRGRGAEELEGGASLLPVGAPSASTAASVQQEQQRPFVPPPASGLGGGEHLQSPASEEGRPGVSSVVGVPQADRGGGLPAVGQLSMNPGGGSFASPPHPLPQSAFSQSVASPYIPPQESRTPPGQAAPPQEVLTGFSSPPLFSPSSPYPAPAQPQGTAVGAGSLGGQVSPQMHGAAQPLPPSSSQVQQVSPQHIQVGSPQLPPPPFNVSTPSLLSPSSSSSMPPLQQLQQQESIGLSTVPAGGMASPPHSQGTLAVSPSLPYQAAPVPPSVEQPVPLQSPPLSSIPHSLGQTDLLNVNQQAPPPLLQQPYASPSPPPPPPPPSVIPVPGVAAPPASLPSPPLVPPQVLQSPYSTPQLPPPSSPELQQQGAVAGAVPPGQQGEQQLLVDSGVPGPTVVPSPVDSLVEKAAVINEDGGGASASASSTSAKSNRPSSSPGAGLPGWTGRSQVARQSSAGGAATPVEGTLEPQPLGVAAVQAGESTERRQGEESTSSQQQTQYALQQVTGEGVAAAVQQAGTPAESVPLSPPQPPGYPGRAPVLIPQVSPPSPPPTLPLPTPSSPLTVQLPSSQPVGTANQASSPPSYQAALAPQVPSPYSPPQQSAMASQGGGVSPPALPPVPPQLPSSPPPLQPQMAPQVANSSLLLSLRPVATSQLPSSPSSLLQPQMLSQGVASSDLPSGQSPFTTQLPSSPSSLQPQKAPPQVAPAPLTPPMQLPPTVQSPSSPLQPQVTPQASLSLPPLAPPPVSPVQLPTFSPQSPLAPHMPAPSPGQMQAAPVALQLSAAAPSLQPKLTATQVSPLPPLTQSPVTPPVSSASVPPLQSQVSPPPSSVPSSPAGAQAFATPQQQSPLGSSIPTVRRLSSLLSSDTTRGPVDVRELPDDEPDETPDASLSAPSVFSLSSSTPSLSLLDSGNRTRDGGGMHEEGTVVGGEDPSTQGPTEIIQQPGQGSSPEEQNGHVQEKSPTDQPPPVGPADENLLPPHMQRSLLGSEDPIGSAPDAVKASLNGEVSQHQESPEQRGDFASLTTRPPPVLHALPPGSVESPSAPTQENVDGRKSRNQPLGVVEVPEHGGVTLQENQRIKEVVEGEEGEQVEHAASEGQDHVKDEKEAMREAHEAEEENLKRAQMDERRRFEQAQAISRHKKEDERWRQLLLLLTFMFAVGFCIASPDSILGATASQDLVERGGAAADGEKAVAIVTAFINGMGAVGALLQGVCTASVTEQFGWDALFALLCLLSMASALLLLPACLDEGRLSRNLLLGECRVPCGFLPKRLSSPGDLDGMSQSGRGQGGQILSEERGGLLLRFPKHGGGGGRDGGEESEELRKKSRRSLSSTFHFRKQDRRKGRKDGGQQENTDEGEDVEEGEEREALHCGGYEASSSSSQQGGEVTVRGLFGCARGKGEGRRREEEFT